MPSTVYSHQSVHQDSGTRTLAASGQLCVDCLRELDKETEAIWRSIRNDRPQFDNGSFDPEFAKAVGRVRDGVEYAIIRDQNEVVGVFPFQRIGQRTAHPVGGMMNDFHGVIARAGTRFDPGQWLPVAGLSQFEFHALQMDPADGATQTRKRVYRELDCPFVDLSAGSFAYREWLLGHSSTLRRQPQKTRAMIRDLGPLRLDFDCRDPQALEQLIQMKRAKFQRTRTFDLLGVDWTSNLLREIFQVRTARFRGQLSVLWAGDTMVAAHFGFVSGRTLHYWFPAHQHEQGRYSPGTQLMYELTGAAQEHNIHRIDFGYGESDLKDRFANGQTTVEYGCYALNPLTRAISNHRYRIRQALKRIPAKESVKKIVRPLWPNLGKGNFR